MDALLPYIAITISTIAATLSLLSLHRSRQARRGIEFTDQVHRMATAATTGETKEARQHGYHLLTEMARTLKGSRNPHINNLTVAALIEDMAELASIVAYETEDVHEEESIRYYESIRLILGRRGPHRTSTPALGLPPSRNLRPWEVAPR